MLLYAVTKKSDELMAHAAPFGDRVRDVVGRVPRMIIVRIVGARDQARSTPVDSPSWSAWQATWCKTG